MDSIITPSAHRNILQNLKIKLLWKYILLEGILALMCVENKWYIMRGAFK